MTILVREATKNDVSTIMEMLIVSLKTENPIIVRRFVF